MLQLLAIGHPAVSNLPQVWRKASVGDTLQTRTVGQPIMAYLLQRCESREVNLLQVKTVGHPAIVNLPQFWHIEGDDLQTSAVGQPIITNLLQRGESSEV